MGVTSRAGLPYPEAADPDMPRIDIQELAAATDGAFAMYDQGPIGTRPTSTPGSPGKEGRLYYATDQKTLYYDYGTGWMPIETRSGLNTALPAEPDDHGQRWVLATGDEAADPVWEFIFDVGISRWRKIGGEPIINQGPTTPSQPYTSTNWATITDLQHRTPVPYPGLYHVKFSVDAVAATVAQFVNISFLIGKTGADDANYDSRADYTYVGTTGNVRVFLEGEYEFAADVEELVIAVKNGSAGNTVNVIRPRIELTPLALTA